jgi:ABC-type transport system involved in multi-copper enzyme maturation permease subunit
MTTTTGAGGQPGFRPLLHAEWTKIRSVRSTAWSLVALVLVATGVSVLATALFGGQWDTLSDVDRRHLLADPIGLILQPGSLWGQIAACVLGVMVIASEYSTGMIRSSLLAVPRRTPVLAAKAVVLAGLVFTVAEMIAFGSFFLGREILASHVTVTLAEPGTWRALVGFGLYLALTSLFALAVGTLIRHVAGSITGALGMVVVLPTVSALLPGKAGDYLDAFLPGGTAGQAIMSSGRWPDDLLSPWQGFGVACLWTALLLAAAAYLLNRRDA